MRYNDAIWEQENLGVKTLEINFGEKDKDIFDDKFINDYGYIVCKINSKNNQIKNLVQQKGFSFIETQMALRLNLKEEQTNIFDNLSKNFHLVEATEKTNMENIISRIDDKMFSTDRIALDDQFGITIANRRYRKWVENEFINPNIKLFSIMKKQNEIGFVMIDIANIRGKGKIDILLGGLYSKYQNMGYGWNIIYQPIKWALKNTVTDINTKVSSNNVDVLKFYISLGYKIEDMEYIFVKHNDLGGKVC